MANRSPYPASPAWLTANSIGVVVLAALLAVFSIQLNDLHAAVKN